MKRYKAVNFEYDDAYGTGTALDIVEHDEGEFVKYDDIKHLLQNKASNSDYIKKPSALEYRRICTKEKINPIVADLIYHLFFI